MIYVLMPILLEYVFFGIKYNLCIYTFILLIINDLQIFLFFGIAYAYT